MTKVQKIFKNITSFAGVFFANDAFKRSGLCKLIDKYLGYHVATKGYTYGNLFYISANKCEALTEEIRQKTDCKTV